MTVTSCQVRTAADALIGSLTLPKAARDRIIDRVAETIRRTQRLNAAARASHTKARRRRLRSLNIRPERLASCIPP